MHERDSDELPRDKTGKLVNEPKSFGRKKLCKKARKKILSEQKKLCLGVINFFTQFRECKKYGALKFMML